MFKFDADRTGAIIVPYMTAPKEWRSTIPKNFKSPVESLIANQPSVMKTRIIHIPTPETESPDIKSPGGLDIFMKPREFTILKGIVPPVTEGIGTPTMQRYFRDNFGVSVHWDRKNNIAQFVNGIRRVGLYMGETFFKTVGELPLSSDAIKQTFGGILLADGALTGYIARHGLVTKEPAANGDFMYAVAIPQGILEKHNLQGSIPEHIRKYSLLEKFGMRPRTLFVISGEELGRKSYNQTTQEMLRNLKPASVTIHHKTPIHA
jgi:hypothetical protein